MWLSPRTFPAPPPRTAHRRRHRPSGERPPVRTCRVSEVPAARRGSAGRAGSRTEVGPPGEMNVRRRAAGKVDAARRALTARGAVRSWSPAQPAGGAAARAREQQNERTGKNTYLTIGGYRRNPNGSTDPARASTRTQARSFVEADKPQTLARKLDALQYRDCPVVYWRSFDEASPALAAPVALGASVAGGLIRSTAICRQDDEPRRSSQPAPSSAHLARLRTLEAISPYPNCVASVHRPLDRHHCDWQ